MDLTINDLDSIMELEVSLFEKPYTRDDYVFLLSDNPHIIAKKLTVNETLIGYGVIQFLYNSANLLTIGIKQDYQSRGYGRKLLLELIEAMKKREVNEIFLEVRVSNQRAINLYKSLGFKENRLRKNYYGNEDGIEMIRKEVENHE